MQFEQDLKFVPKGQEVKLDSKGRISVPVSVRRNLKLEPGKVFEVLISDNMLIYRLIK
jgi:AbrB family looped-hinge helix DNA binding protein